jgi:hypothetical protein
MSRFSSVLKIRPVITPHIKPCLVPFVWVLTHPIRGHITMWTDITVLKRNTHKYPTDCVFLHTGGSFQHTKCVRFAVNWSCLYARRKAIRLISFQCPFHGRTDKKAHYGRAIFYVPADSDYAYYNN